MTKLYLARHGQTADNAARIMQGQTHGRLTDMGKAQAVALCGSLSGVHIDAFVASDLKRAVDTAEIIASRRNMSVETTPLLRERDWGSFTGRFIPSLAGEEWPDDIETADALRERAGSFLEYIRERYPGMTVLAVGHGIINKAVQAVYYNKDMKDIERMDNAEVRVLMI
ncbi:histidine phosphatase family protein [Xylanibacter muris]|uniref:Histidine phosphatase family protein n=1 Tax=Xylanibacter muris TaxID=2736290 RepID=A0ABX2AML8_9BACT|nr:histidine phosphatase family protein [Xylanibacter muris]NPD92360.1 histidine phosphatase family protein [Xylanibacter muris]